MSALPLALLTTFTRGLSNSGLKGIGVLIVALMALGAALLLLRPRGLMR